ncbi:monovalent cation/H+ antiporter complex subunit F [Thioalkalivibrio sp.]|uniref:monovalent cation/H+ antiporter complex subunit F n=1 Tax=Thioalkalivibrio sp. TaxID=2093813 RepID=UPI0012D56CE8|nr:monovalent cation/H+ antiporter complex subunit F [Thioalkalivibrio sp.]TVP76254.1 MAG: multiple resistance and pH regulation protein F [Thioalkalivibrio sp.]
MTELYPVVVLLLLLNIVVGMVRILRGPTAADRMLAAEMFATSAVVIVLLMAVVSGNLALIDVALVFALLAALASVTFVSRAWSAMAGSRPGVECEDDERGGTR